MTGYGQESKSAVRSFYTAPIAFGTRGEMLARFENFVEIDKDVVDDWRIPVLKFHCLTSDNGREMAEDAAQDLKTLMRALGSENNNVWGRLMDPGYTMQGMGTARMGTDPKKSVLNKFNQAHDVSNLLSVDGEWFVTLGGFGPTLTIGALTARSSALVLSQIQTGEL